MKVRGPSIPGEVPRPLRAVERHNAPSPDPRRGDPCPAVGRVVDEGLWVGAVQRRFTDVLDGVRHPEPAILRGENPLSAPYWLLWRLRCRHPAVRRRLLRCFRYPDRAVLIRMDPPSLCIRRHCGFALSLGLDLDLLRRGRGLLRRNGRNLSGRRSRWLNGCLRSRRSGL